MERINIVKRKILDFCPLITEGLKNPLFSKVIQGYNLPYLHKYI